MKTKKIPKKLTQESNKQESPGKIKKDIKGFCYSHGGIVEAPDIVHSK